MDLVLVAIIVVLFLLAGWLARICERL